MNRTVLVIGIIFLLIGVSIVSSTDNISKISSVNKSNNPPYPPGNPNPCNGTFDMSICPNLSWTGGDPDGDNVTYDVWFGDSELGIYQVAWNLTETWFQVWDLDFMKKYYWYVVARDEYGAYTVGPLWNFRTEQNYPPNPAEDPIPVHGDVGVPTEGVILKWKGSDPNECDTLYYDVYFDDVNPPLTQRVDEGYDDYWEVPFTLLKYKTYYWRIDTWDKTGEFCEGKVWRFSTNCFPPSDPIIDGPHHGVKNQEYTFIFMSTNPENYSVQYHVKWGDGTENRTEFYPSGEIVALNHSWNSNGKKLIQARVRAYDEYGPVSGWSIFEFTVPRSRVFNLTLFELLFTQFPLIQRLLDIWRDSIE